jgi:hypothetical protein
LFLKTLVLFFILAMGSTVSIPAQLGTGTLNGTVTDVTGAVIPAATLTLTKTGTNVSRTMIADKRGHYSVPDVNVGQYNLAAAAPGFGTATKAGIEVTVGAQLTVDVPLAAGSQSTTVTAFGIGYCASGGRTNVSASIMQLLDSRISSRSAGGPNGSVTLQMEISL